MRFILKNLVVLFAIFLSGTAFADTPPSPNPPQGTTPPDLPVDQYVYVLFAIAIFFAFYAFKKKISIK